LRKKSCGEIAADGAEPMFEQCTWLNEPSDWNLQGGVLNVVTDANTDFWRETHYGFTRDSGHLFHRATAGDFTAELRVVARYDELYDQAGIMVRIDEANWVKAGVEMSDGRAWLSSVLTLGRSDWATGIFEGDPTDFRLRATVKSGVLRLQVSAGGVWRLLRLAPFPRADSYAVGPMCCTPERAGLRVRFSEFSVGPALEKGLHDLS
jgi:regulation of enolase protein 1 (concanavalin A-like superfamily)